MNTVIIIAGSLLISASFLIAYIGYRSERTVRPKQRLLLLGLRMLLLTATILLIMQPRFSCEKLASQPDRITILFDNSRSMQLFIRADSVISLQNQLNTFLRSAQINPAKIDWFYFGDSLRSLKPYHPSLDDQQSVFPNADLARLESKTKAFIVVSDGQWNNSQFDVDNYFAKPWYYIPLSIHQKQAFLTITTNTPRVIVPLDTVYTLPVAIDGFIPAKNDLLLSWRSGSRILGSRRIKITTESVADTLLIPLRADKAGTSRIVISLINSVDTIAAYAQCMQHVIPTYFNAAIYSPLPTLDSRFIAAAVLRNTQCRLVSATADKPIDIRIFTGGTDSDSRSISTQSDKAIRLYAGCLPGTSNPHYRPLPAKTKFITSSTIDQSIDLATLPIPEQIIEVPAGLLKSPYQTLISAVLPNNNQRQTADTLPVVIQGNWQGKPCIITTIPNIWALEFWPMGNSARGKTSFGDALIELCVTQRLSTLSGTWYATPEQLPVYENDSSTMVINQPSEAIDAPFTLTISDQHAKTIATLLVTNHQSQANVTMPLLKAGPYTYALKQKNQIVFSDSLSVIPNRSEFCVSDQNRLLLDQFCRSITLRDTLNAQTLFNHATDRPVISTAWRIEKNWWLLLLIMGIWGAEWIVRKRFKLE